VAGCCERDDKPSDSVRGKYLLDQLSEYQHLKQSLPLQFSEWSGWLVTLNAGFNSRTISLTSTFRPYRGGRSLKLITYVHIVLSYRMSPELLPYCYWLAHCDTITWRRQLQSVGFEDSVSKLTEPGLVLCCPNTQSATHLQSPRVSRGQEVLCLHFYPAAARARHWTQTWASWIHSTPSYPVSFTYEGVFKSFRTES